MSATIQPQDWLHFVEREYLSAFIPAGGSAIKFAVPMNGVRPHDILDGLSEIGTSVGLLSMRVSAVETKVSQMDEVFFRIAEQVPWRVLSRKMIAKLAAEAGYSWTDEGQRPLYEMIAGHNHVDAQLLLLDLKKSIGDNIFKKRNLSRDFRVAMTHLCIAELTGGQDAATTSNALIDWLTGKNKAVGAVKPYQIYRKITRYTARYFFESLTRWIRFAGYTGTLILFDAQRVMLACNPHDESRFYSKPAVLDAYEILRQFIDSADHLEGCFIAVVPSRTFLDDPARGLGAYEALKFRVLDEIRDKNLVNPMASLARISTVAHGVGHHGQ